MGRKIPKDNRSYPTWKSTSNPGVYRRLQRKQVVKKREQAPRALTTLETFRLSVTTFSSYRLLLLLCFFCPSLSVTHPPLSLFLKCFFFCSSLDNSFAYIRQALLWDRLLIDSVLSSYLRIPSGMSLPPAAVHMSLKVPSECFPLACTCPFSSWVLAG